jgi:hypothetical protein
MGSKPMKGIFSMDIKLKKNKENRQNKEKVLSSVKEMNSLTMNEKFRSKTGYLVQFIYNESSLDKIVNLITSEQIIRAEVVRKNTLYQLCLLIHICIFL